MMASRARRNASAARSDSAVASDRPRSRVAIACGIGWPSATDASPPRAIRPVISIRRSPAPRAAAIAAVMSRTASA